MELAQSLPGGGTGTTSGGAQLWSENQTQQPLETPQGSPSPDNWHTAIPLTASQTHHPANMPPWPRNNTTAASGAMPSSTTGPHPGQSIPKQWRLWEWATSPMPADLWTVPSCPSRNPPCRATKQRAPEHAPISRTWSRGHQGQQSSSNWEARSLPLALASLASPALPTDACALGPLSTAQRFWTRACPPGHRLFGQKTQHPENLSA